MLPSAASGLLMVVHSLLALARRSVFSPFSSSLVRICTFNADQNCWVHPTGVHVQEKEEVTGSDTPTTANKTRGSIFCVCWDRTGQLLCRGSLDGSFVVVSTYYDPSQPFDFSMILMCRIRECPFDLQNKDVFGFVFGDKVGVVEDIAVNLSNTAFAYTGEGIEGVSFRSQ